MERAFDLLELLSAAGGTLALSQLAALAGLPLPTIHRLVRTLVARGYVRQDQVPEVGRLLVAAAEELAVILRADATA